MADFPYERGPDAAAEEAHRAPRRRPAEPGERHPLEHARRVADAIVDALRPACMRIEVAGSIRRECSEVKDIEIVCVPKIARDLFGEMDETKPHDVQLLVQSLVDVGRLAPRLTSAGIARRGRRSQALVATKSGIPLDLFCVLPPASWGAILAIRTGPAAYSERLVTACQKRGLRCTDGRLVDARGREVPTPEERQFIEACGVEYSEPWERGSRSDGHHCHALGCTAACPPEYLMCGGHWARVPRDLQDEVYRTVRLRGPDVDSTWAPWWRAAHRAIAAVARFEGRDVDAWLAGELATADQLERSAER